MRPLILETRFLLENADLDAVVDVIRGELVNHSDPNAAAKGVADALWKNKRARLFLLANPGQMHPWKSSLHGVLYTPFREWQGSQKVFGLFSKAWSERVASSSKPAPALKDKARGYRWTSSGGVVIPSLRPDEAEYVYLIRPRGRYGGKTWTLPKGRVDDGETKEATAVREVREETGLHAKVIPGSYLGVFKGSMSQTHYFVMLQTGGRPTKNDEVSEIRLVAFDEALKMLKSGGNPRDVKVLAKAVKFVRKWLRTDKKSKRKVRKVVRTGREWAEMNQISIRDMVDKKGRKVPSKVVLRLPRKEPRELLVDFLSQIKVKAQQHMAGNNYNMVVVFRRSFDTSRFTQEIPT